MTQRQNSPLSKGPMGASCFKDRSMWDLSFVPNITQTGGKERKLMQAMEKLSKNISVIISLFPHLVNVLWRGTGIKLVQDFGKRVRKNVQNPILLKFLSACSCKKVGTVAYKGNRNPKQGPLLGDSDLTSSYAIA